MSRDTFPWQQHNQNCKTVKLNWMFHSQGLGTKTAGNAPPPSVILRRTHALTRLRGRTSGMHDIISFLFRALKTTSCFAPPVSCSCAHASNHVSIGQNNTKCTGIFSGSVRWIFFLLFTDKTKSNFYKKSYEIQLCYPTFFSINFTFCQFWHVSFRQFHRR